MLSFFVASTRLYIRGQMKGIFYALRLASALCLLSCKTTQEATPPPSPGSTQTAAQSKAASLPEDALVANKVPGPYQEPDPCAGLADCSLESGESASLPAPKTPAGPFLEARVFRKKIKDKESTGLALQTKAGWFFVEGPSPGETTPESQIVTKSHLKTLSIQAKYLTATGTLQQDVFCTSCQNPNAKTTPSTTYTTELLLICGLDLADTPRCLAPISSLRDQDGPTRLMYQLTTEGQLLLEAEALSQTSLGPKVLPAGRYSLSFE